MSQILHIDSSGRSDRSFSRHLTEEFVRLWQERHPADSVTYRDLGLHPLPAVDDSWIAASATPPAQHTPEMEQAIALSNRLIDELLSADILVIGLPMYNLSVPTQFKAYIDQIVRSGRTFAVKGAGQYEGLIPSGKKVLVITTRGGQFRPGTPAAAYDFQEPYVRAIFGLMGLTDLTFVHADGLAFGEEERDRSLAEARKQLRQLIDQW